MHVFAMNLPAVNFYAPDLKGPPEASSVWIVRLSVCLCVIPSRLQTKSNI